MVVEKGMMIVKELVLLLMLFSLWLMALPTCAAFRTPTRLMKVVHKRWKSSQLDVMFPKEKVFVFGIGYVGELLSMGLLNDQYEVCGTCTTRTKADDLRKLGIRAHILGGHVEDSDILEDVQSSEYVLNCIPPEADAVGIHDPAWNCFRQLMETSCERVRKNLKWLGYVSSTGVYGDCNGVWVSEDQPVNPTVAKAHSRAHCEQLWMHWLHAYGLPVHIFRVAGIYGPGRSVLDTTLKSMRDFGSLPPADNQTVTSRIHVADVVQCLRASMANPTPGDIYNVADDEPCSRFEMLSYIVQRAKCESAKSPVLQALANAEINVGSTTTRPSSRGGSKRVDNKKIRHFLKTLGRELLYPNYRRGVDALLKDYFPNQTAR